jgi:hypothetical protein
MQREERHKHQHNARWSQWEMARILPYVATNRTLRAFVLVHSLKLLA